MEIERIVGVAIAGLLQALIYGGVTWVLWKLTRNRPMMWHMFTMSIFKLPGYLYRRYWKRQPATIEHVSTARKD